MIHIDGGSDGSDGGTVLTCSPLTQMGCQAGEKCTWIIDATDPQYVGHVGCVPDGTADVGAACMFGAAGATGYDDCKAGGVCSQFSTPGTAGVCKQVCDNAGGDPMCDASHVCVTYSRLFSTGSTSPAAAGVCDLACDPLEDNDFDGSAGSATKSMNTCGSDARIGCYGYPSGGTPPATGWSCTGDINSDPDKGLRHRTECTTTTGCADTGDVIYINSCNQGYLPIFRESTAVSTAVCIAMCKPLNCYAGNCGPNNTTVNRHGAAPHRCQQGNGIDARGTFNTNDFREECEYLWSEEIDGSGNVLVSPTSDSMGFCFDHGLYKYDPTNGNNPTIPLPGCEQLQLHGTDEGSNGDPNDPTTYFGAVDFGCVDTTTAFGSAAGKLQVRRPTGVTIDKPRFLYHRVMGSN